MLPLPSPQVCANPFEHSDIVTTTTHKSLRGPRAGLIFFRRGKRAAAPAAAGAAAGAAETDYDYEEKINASVFPTLQGGPHNNTIAAIAVCLKEVCSVLWWPCDWWC